MTAEPVEAVRELRARGIDNAEDLLEHGTPDQILSACRRWDARPGVGPGLLARWVRDGQFGPPAESAGTAKKQGARSRQRFAAVQLREGSIAEPHRRLLERRWPDDVERALENDHPICDGLMVVTSATYPVLAMECDACGFEAGITPRQLHVLPSMGGHSGGEQGDW